MAPDGVKEKSCHRHDDDIDMYSVYLFASIAINSLCSGEDIESTRNNLFVANLWHDSTYTGYACVIKRK